MYEILSDVLPRTKIFAPLLNIYNLVDVIIVKSRLKSKYRNYNVNRKVNYKMIKQAKLIIKINLH